MASGRTLTELEGCVLGLVWSKGPSTAYAVRRELQRSASPHWSGSAGAIYPLIGRLARRGLIRSGARATGRRRSRVYAVTPAGLAALRGWLGPPFPDVVVGPPPDPLRTRLYFLEALPAPLRRRFLAEAEERVRGQLARLEEGADWDGGEGPWTVLADRGALRAMAGRLAWLEEVRRALERAPADASGDG